MIQLAFDFTPPPADPARAALFAAFRRAGPRMTYADMPDDVAVAWGTMMAEVYEGSRPKRRDAT